MGKTDTSNFVDQSKIGMSYEDYLALKSPEKLQKDLKHWEAAKKHGWPAKTVGMTGV